MVSKQTWRVDLLILIGLVLLGLGIWLRLGDAAVAMYAGTVLITIGVLLSTTSQRGGEA
jgi:cyanate permease